MGTDESQVMAYLEQYANIFNSVAQDIVQRASIGDQQPSPLLGDLQKLQALLSGENRCQRHV